MLTYLLMFFGTSNLVTAATPDCSHTEYDRCVRIADPLVREARLIFPDNAEDIDIVCKTWNRFVDCLDSFTENCFTEQQKKQFNRAVERPIESVHEMCTRPQYQHEYLQYASCIKSTITERIHCGPQYSLLVEQVSQGDVISKSTLCCSHERFKQCVQAETRRLCDGGVYDGPAAKFANHIIDKALSFLQDQCFNYIPNSGDCPSPTADNLPFSDHLTISSSSSEVYPWSTIQDEIAKEILPSRVTPPKITTTAWLPSSSNIPQEYSPSSMHTTQFLGSRSRPSSHGRAIWPESSQSPGNTMQMSREPTPPSSTVFTRPQFSTVRSWNVMGQKSADNRPNIQNNDIYNREQETTTQTHWYPAAGSQSNNEVDEPNQQGLVKPRKNGGQSDSKSSEIISITVIAIMASFC